MGRSTTPDATAVARRPYSMAIMLAAVVVILALGVFLSTGAARIWWEVVILGIVEG